MKGSFSSEIDEKKSIADCFPNLKEFTENLGDELHVCPVCLSPNFEVQRHMVKVIFKNKRFKYENGYRVQCTDCGVSSPEDINYDKGIKNWNNLWEKRSA